MSEGFLLVGQNKAWEDRIDIEADVGISYDHRKQFEDLNDGKRREVLWNLHFRHLQMNIDFVGVGEPLQDVTLTQRIHLDGFAKEAFIQRVLAVRHAVITVIWSTIKDLVDVKPPAISTEKIQHE